LGLQLLPLAADYRSAARPLCRGLFVEIFFAARSVLITFALGSSAVMFDVPEMPLRRPLRSLLLIPYAIPAFISVPIRWVRRSPDGGERMLADWSELPPRRIPEPHSAKVGVLSYPAPAGLSLHVRDRDRERCSRCRETSSLIGSRD
jgi:ABC-type sugar transport system permease subunit